MPAPRQYVNGKNVYGAAAQQHIIKQNGGWDKFISKIAKESAEEATSTVFAKLQQVFSKPNLKRVK